MVKRGRRAYIPERGDILWIDFSPHQGHEQASRRPAVALSPLKYNKSSGLVVVCPITSKRKGYPFEVDVTAEKTQGVALADHVHSLDWRERSSVFIEQLNHGTLRQIQKRIVALIEQ
jgi:mRNA interferase MazF